MSELRIIRGRDIAAFINERKLCGVTELDVTAKQKLHPVHEYLSGTPRAVLPGGKSYRIRLRMLSMFSYHVPTDRMFTLSIREEDYIYIFDQCRVVQQYTDAQGDKGIKEVFQIEAQIMRKQEVEDD